MKCISVGTAGDVSIVWKNNGAAASFRSYHIFYSINETGPFTLIDSVNVFANQSYIDGNADANIQDAYYYIELNNLNGTTVLSDTIKAIRLTVLNPNDGYADLQWNNSHTPQVSTQSQYHLIYREYPAGVFTLIDSIDATGNALSYSDEISICGDSVKYRVEIHDASGCTSLSSIDGDFFTDQIAPSIPEVDSVSIDGSGLAVIGWNQSSSNDTYAYVVLQIVGANIIPLDTVYGIGTTFYQTSIDGTMGSQAFRLVAIDTCGNTCAAYPQQETIFLQGSLDRCSGSMELTWTDYINSPASPVYSIVMNENGGGDILLGITTATQFTAVNLKTDSSYCFRVIADLDGLIETSTSNSLCVTPDLPVAPQYSLIRSVSVYPNDVVSVIVYVDPAADVKEYKLLRAGDSSGNYAVVQTQAFAGASMITFTDNVTTERPWYYKVATIDSCGNDAFPTQVCQSTALSSLSVENFHNSLVWNTYVGWQSGVYRVLIYRSVDGIADPSPLAMISNGDTTYSDDVQDLVSTEGQFCYYIVSYEAQGNPFGFQDSVRSNEICVQQKTAIYIPNAFRPGGANNEFNPAEAFTGIDNYSLVIYNRFGEQIFKTENTAEGWDGSTKGHDCELGVYVFRLKARDEKGSLIDRVGRVTLIR